MIPKFETERLTLRDWIASDREPFIQMNSDLDVMRNFPRHLSRKESLAFIEKSMTLLAREKYGYWAVEEKSTNEFLGFVALAEVSFQSRFTPCIEIGWRFKKSAWGKGFASEGARKLLEYGFDSLALNEIVSLTAKVNERSWRVMERIGMLRDFENDFDHPRVAEGSHLRPHVLYRIKKSEWQGQRTTNSIFS